MSDTEDFDSPADDELGNESAENGNGNEPRDRDTAAADELPEDNDLWNATVDDDDVAVRASMAEEADEIKFAPLAKPTSEVSSSASASEAELGQAITPDTRSDEQANAEEVAPPKKVRKEKLAAAQPRVISDEQLTYPWYVVHTYSGYELRAKANLEERIRSKGLEEYFGNILVPQETVVELVRGIKKTSTRKFFPGYILVQVNLNDDTWHLVKDTPKVTGFVGDSRNPVPLSPEEVANLTQQMQGGATKPRPRVQFEEGDAIKVIDGPFTDFNGTVDEVKADKGKLRVLISIFGRNTPVELDFVQVEKA